MKYKIFKFIAASAMVWMTAGCIVLSVYPFYTSNDLISDPGLAGHWAKAEATNEIWQFTGTGEKAFLLTTADDQTTNCFEAHMFRLELFDFLDLLTTNRQEFQLPLHLISKMAHDDTNLTLSFMDYGWLAGYLETNSAALRHIAVPQEAAGTNGGNMVYLTSTTRELQKFLLKHVADTNAFSVNSSVKLKRVSP